jgi:hypothetical protein
MSAPSNKGLKAHRKSRKIPADLEERQAMRGSCPTPAVEDQNLIEVDYDDGYPAGFTISDNRDIWREPLQQLTFSPRTLGVWVMLKSLPRGWVIRVNHLRKVLGMGRDALRTTLTELEEKGRLERVQVRNPDGTYGRQRWVIRRGGFHRSVSPTSPTPENQASVNAGDWKSGNGSSGAGISGPLATTEAVPNTEATTTSPALIPPTSLPPDEARVVVREAEKAVSSGKIYADHAQPILDELEGALRRGRRTKPIEKPVSYLRSLIKRAQADEFIPDVGPSIERERQKRALELEQMAQRAKQKQLKQAARNDPEAHERIRRHLAEYSRRFGMEPQSAPTQKEGNESLAPSPLARATLKGQLSGYKSAWEGNRNPTLKAMHHGQNMERYDDH